MAKGTTHDKFNLVVGSIIVGIMVGISIKWHIALSFSVGWLIATFILTPDLDIGPKSRRSWLGIILYPYSVMFKHRGISHSFFLGTLTRVIYVYIIFVIISFIMTYFDFLNRDQGYLKLIFAYDYEQMHYQILTWIFIGMFLADACHILLDRLFSIKKSFL